MATDNIPPPSPGNPGEDTSNISPMPRHIGPYKIESLLEKGGMSILYLATHPETKEPVTIKVLSPRYVSNPEIVQRFLNEAEIIAMADHPNIIRLYGHGEWAGGLYIAMEFVQGISLRQYLLQTPMSLRKSLEIILDISYALCHLHTHGVIHRDLKPENILVTDSGSIKVIDFGIAQLLTIRISPADPAKQRLIGTPIYMSPEQRENPETVSYPSDIYSLGIISYELILGKLSHGQIHLALMPKGIQKILHKALQYKPEDRYLDIVDFITDMTSYLNSESLQKEKKVGDHLSELSENLKHAQSILIPAEVPHWPSTEIGISSYRSLTMTGIYCDFFELPDQTYGILMAESSAKGADALIYISVLRGMVRTLCRMTANPVDFIEALNNTLINDKLNQTFKISYIALSPSTHQMHCISCGCDNLLFIKAEEMKISKISTDNIALGIEGETKFVDATHSWDEGDSFYISNLSTILEQDKDFIDNLFNHMVLEHLSQSPQKSVDAILRKIKVTAMKQLQERSITLVCVQYKRS